MDHQPNTLHPTSPTLPRPCLCRLLTLNITVRLHGADSWTTPLPDRGHHVSDKRCQLGTYLLANALHQML